MSVKDHMDRLNAGVLNGMPAAPAAPSTPVRRPSAFEREKRSVPGLTAPGALAHFSKDYQDLEIEVMRLKSTQGLPATLPLGQLHTSPYQTRNIDPSKVAELVSNLKSNPLSTPVTVRRIEDGKYEVVAGHHRIEAFKVLGRTEISASVIGLTDDEAEKLVFYDNLISPSLTDFEKFKGYARLKKSLQMTSEQLAIEAGVSESIVSQILSYDKLPKDVIAELERYPAAVGSRLAQNLASLPETLTDKIIEAIGRIKNGLLTQTNAVDWITEKARPAKPTEILIRTGQQRFAGIVRRDKTVTIKFTSDEDVDASLKAVVDLLKRSASAKK